MNKKKTAKLFGAKKEVTKKDAKMLKPLSKWLRGRVVSNDNQVRTEGFVLGAVTVLIADLLIRSF